jgi:oligo-1,6-glucosidase
MIEICKKDAAGIIIIKNDGGGNMKTNHWWHNRVIYQIYPRSFCDSNQDGIGDIPGIISKLDYLVDLGVGAIWLSPVYRSPNADNGYDISDYQDINPEYGTLDDMKRLLAEAEARNIKIIMDLVINHTSDEHGWFQQSIDPASPYHDYYIWRPGRVKNGRELPPNNWQSQFTGSAWTKHPKNGLYYLHLFTPKQPDLNYHNERVIEEVKNLMKFWLDLGVAGFRCDVINMIYKTTLDDGKPRIFQIGQEHYLSQKGSHLILKRFHDEVWQPYGAYTVGETVNLDAMTAQQYTDGQLETVFQFDHTNVDQWLLPIFRIKYHPEKMARTLKKWQEVLPWNTLFFENHDIPRSISRFGDVGKHRVASGKMLATLIMTLRGIPFVYQGQEIGTLNTPFRDMKEIDDVSSQNVYKILRSYHIGHRLAWKMILGFCRDHARTPMAWSDGPNGGFSTVKPWLRDNGHTDAINVKADQTDPDSIWNYYRELIRFRNQSKALQVGTIRIEQPAREVLSYVREYRDESVAVLINLGSKTRNLPKSVRGTKIFSNRRVDDDFSISKLEPYQAIVFSAK